MSGQRAGQRALGVVLRPALKDVERVAEGGHGLRPVELLLGGHLHQPLRLALGAMCLGPLSERGASERHQIGQPRVLGERIEGAHVGAVIHPAKPVYRNDGGGATIHAWIGSSKLALRGTGL